MQHIAKMQLQPHTEASSPSRLMSAHPPSANESAPPYSSPVEEKIAYDPLAAVERQRSQKEGHSIFQYVHHNPASSGRPCPPSEAMEAPANTQHLLIVTSSDWDVKESMDRKAAYAASTPEMPLPRPPVHYPVGNYLENDSRYGHCLPEVVVSSNLPEVIDAGQISANPFKNPKPYSPNNETMSMAPSQFLTVTPLHLLGDQPDMIDCPFCLRRTETKVVREASPITHVLASLCCITTVLGVAAPYVLNWATHIEQHCTNCNRRVTRKPHGKQEVQIFGTPADQRMPSRYPAAEFPPDDEVPPPPPAKNHVGPNELYA